MMQFLDYKDKICVVTGAASGMGKAVAKYLVQLGARVHAIDYAPVDLSGVEQTLEINLANREEIDEAFAKLPQKINHFFGVAGVSGQHHDYNTTMKINFLANKYMVEDYLLDRMQENGSIAFVSSLAGLWWENHTDETRPFFESRDWEATLEKILALDLNDTPGTNAYFLSKRLVNHLVAEYAPEFMKQGVRINATMPAAATTGLTKDFADMMGGEENLVTGYADGPATAEEMAQPLLFLNSSMSTYITGICLPIDAGESSQQMINKKVREYDFDIFE